MHTRTHAHMHTHTRAHMHTHTRAHMHTRTHAHTHTRTHAHTHTRTRAHTHTRTHAHMHTCTAQHLARHGLPGFIHAVIARQPDVQLRRRAALAHRLSQVCIGAACARARARARAHHPRVQYTLADRALLADAHPPWEPGPQERPDALCTRMRTRCAAVLFLRVGLTPAPTSTQTATRTRAQRTNSAARARGATAIAIPSSAPWTGARAFCSASWRTVPRRLHARRGCAQPGSPATARTRERERERERENVHTHTRHPPRPHLVGSSSPPRPVRAVLGVAPAGPRTFVRRALVTLPMPR